MENVAVFLAMGLFLLLLCSGMNIASVLGMAGLIAIYFLCSKGSILVTATPVLAWNISSSYVFTAVPLFIFMGELLSQSALTDVIYDGLGKILGRVPGGLLHANIAACTVFGAMCGSAVATSATIGTAAYGEMERRGYERGMVLGTLSVGGTLGILIPPSAPMIVYGGITGESVGHLFMGGLGPGLLLAVLFMVYIIVVSKLRPNTATLEKEVPLKVKLIGLVKMSPAAIVILAVLGTIYMGIATPTEAAAIGALAAMGVAVLYRRLNLETLKEAVLRTVRTTCMVMFIVVGGIIWAYGLTYMGVGRWISGTLLSSQFPSLILISFICFAYLVMGCFMDGVSMIVMTMPIIYPIIIKLGFSGIWFGAITTILTGVGTITPPVGLCLYVLQGISGRSLGEVSRGSMPFVFLCLIGVILCIVFPDVVLWLPNKMGR
jgi:C4-dicarboxylate transporter DctM subunit